MVSKEQFESEALAFLKANAAPRPNVSTGWGEGSDRVTIFDEKPPAEEIAEAEAAKAWRGRVFDAGFGWITGPGSYGGRELPAEYEQIWQQCEAQFITSSKTPFSIGLGMIAPTILAHGTDVAKDAYLRRLYRGEIIACQLFSEPGAGSDLASVATRAVRDGDEWVITGQKVWTSGAHYSDIGEIVCRTDPDQPKHKGLTVFIVDMHAAGVEVRPLRQMTGGASFNEVFLTEVRVSDDLRLGGINEGWGVALTTLMNERASIGGGAGGVIDISLDRLAQMIDAHGMTTNPVIRQQFANVYIQTKVAGYLNQYLVAKVPPGKVPGPEMSLSKAALTAQLQKVAGLVSTVLGPSFVADTGEWGSYAWAEFVLGLPGLRIAGGTDEVLRNIIGERVLGLSKDPPSVTG